MAENIEAFGQRYEDELFARLAPKVESAVRQLFPATRGARFGAMQSILAKRLAALKTEIALDSAKKKYERDEQIRREEVADRRTREARAATQGETLRAEQAKRTDEYMKENAKRHDQYIKDLRSEQESKRNLKYQAEILKYGGLSPESYRELGVTGTDPAAPRIGSDRKRKKRPDEYGGEFDLDSMIGRDSLTQQSFMTPYYSRNYAYDPFSTITDPPTSRPPESFDPRGNTPDPFEGQTPEERARNEENASRPPKKYENWGWIKSQIRDLENPYGGVEKSIRDFFNGSRYPSDQSIIPWAEQDRRGNEQASRDMENPQGRPTESSSNATWTPNSGTAFRPAQMEQEPAPVGQNAPMARIGRPQGASVSNPFPGATPLPWMDVAPAEQLPVEPSLEPPEVRAHRRYPSPRIGSRTYLDAYKRAI